MERKKSPKADLEKQRLTFFQIGLVVSLVIMLLAFECKRTPGDLLSIQTPTWSTPDDDLVINTFREEKPEPKPKIIQPSEVIDVIDNDEDELEDVLEIDSEADQNTEIEVIELPDEVEVDEKYDFFSVQTKPEFEGGTNGFLKFVYSNIKYPVEAIENNIEGTVFMEFTINKKGNVVNVNVIKSIHPSLSNEAMRVIKMSPKWKPGKQRAKPVNVTFSIPVKFELQ